MQISILRYLPRIVLTCGSACEMFTLNVVCDSLHGLLSFHFRFLRFFRLHPLILFVNLPAIPWQVFHLNFILHLIRVAYLSHLYNITRKSFFRKVDIPFMRNNRIVDRFFEYIIFFHYLKYIILFLHAV